MRRGQFFSEKVKIKVGGGTVERTEKVYIKKQNPPEKSQGDNRRSKNESCIKLLGKIAKERAKKCFGKTNPPGMIRGELFTVFFSYLRSCGSLSSIGNAGSSAVGGLVVLFAAGSEAKNSHKSCECKCDVLFHFVFPPNENIEYVCVFFLAEPCSAARTGIAAGSRFQHGKS